MFQSPKKRLQALLDVVDDMLVGALEPEPEAAPHPHRRPARVRIERRVGAVSPRAMHCLSPVRSAAPVAPAPADAAVGDR